MNQELIELFNTLRVRTAMYLGCLSITRLRAYTGGFLHANAIHNPGSIESDTLLRFTKTLASKYSIKKMLGWDGILLQVSGNDEKAALELFWQEWDEFCTQQESDVNKS